MVAVSCPYSGIAPPVDAHKTYFPNKLKCYDKSESTCGQLSARKNQICWVYFLSDTFWPFFKINFQIRSEQKWSLKNWIRLVKYSCVGASGPSGVPWFFGKLFLVIQGNQTGMCMLDIYVCTICSSNSVKNQVSVQSANTVPKKLENTANPATNQTSMFWGLQNNPSTHVIFSV